MEISNRTRLCSGSTLLKTAICFIWLGALSAVETASAAQLSEAIGLNESIKQISRYPAGQLPFEPSIVDALDQIRNQGSLEEISLLRHLTEHEQPPIQKLASDAIAAIQLREREQLRLAFVEELPKPLELEVPTHTLTLAGHGREIAACIAYQQWILRSTPLKSKLFPTSVLSTPIDAEQLRARGRPYSALILADGQPSREARKVAARAREDMGDTSGAILYYAWLAIDEDVDAWSVLNNYGVDTERFLLGLWADSEIKNETSDARVLEVLVRQGGRLTVSVLAEQAQLGSLSQKMVATDALSRMLEPSLRVVPLSSEARDEASLAMVKAERVLGDLALR